LRLGVLVPTFPLDEAALARVVAGRAGARALSVLYLGLARDAAGEAALRRRLATLAALTRTDQLAVDTHLAAEPDWVAAIRAARLPGDELACLPGQSALGWGRRRALSVALAAALGLVVHELAGVPATIPAVTPRRATLGAGLGFVTLVLIFFWIQVQAGRLPAGPVQAVFLTGLVLAEFALIAGWDRLTH
jgi:hypothetical protein